MLENLIRTDTRVDKTNELISFENLANDQKLAQKQNLFLDQGSRLESGKRVALEAEGTAIDTMNILKVQRDQLSKANTGAREISRDLGKSNHLINTMNRRNVANRLIMIGVFVFLIVTLAVVFYEKNVKK